MNSLPFIKADAAYRVAAECIITAETVAFEPVRAFTRASYVFRRELEGLGSDTWRAFERKLARVGWDLLNAPLPLSSTGLGLATVSRELDRMAERNRYTSDPAIVVEARELVSRLSELGNLQADPLGERCKDILSTGNLRRSGVLVREVDWRNAASASWKAAGTCVAFFVPNDLRESPPMETLVVVGQARFYPESILSAPRAENIGIVRYGWLSDMDAVPPLFPGTGSQPIRIRHFALPSESEAPEESGLEPLIDWEAITQLHGVPPGSSSIFDQDTDHVSAYLYLLAGSFGVYLEAEEGPSVMVVDPEADDDQRVGHKQARLLEASDFVLLRKERSEYDFLEEVANRLLGPRASALRAAQARWKELLGDLVRARGADEVARDLAARGASVQNVRYWMSPDSIRTRLSRDFEILMGYVGLGNEAKDIWAQMARIDAAHRLAGMRIRRALLGLVRTADLSRLASDGLLDFDLDLPGEDAGVLSIFRVEGRSPNTVVVQRHQLRVPFRVDRELWLG